LDSTSDSGEATLSLSRFHAKDFLLPQNVGKGHSSRK
jgi:hypothetical protein